MIDFARFDARGYRTVDVRSGYGEWVATYDETVEDAMDVELLAELREVQWPTIERAVDLGCGTGRTGKWLREQGAAAIDGVDLTPEMLAIARERGVYESLVEADVASTGLEAGRYDLVTVCLVDEHLAALGPVYAEAWRLARVGAACVVVGYHPHFIMAAGIPTHFDDASGEPVAIETHVHPLSEHVGAALGAGWRLAELHERTVDDAWVAMKPHWEQFRDQPISFAFVWRK